MAASRLLCVRLSPALFDLLDDLAIRIAAQRSSALDPPTRAEMIRSAIGLLDQTTPRSHASESSASAFAVGQMVCPAGQRNRSDRSRYEITEIRYGAPGSIVLVGKHAGRSGKAYGAAATLGNAQRYVSDPDGHGPIKSFRDPVPAGPIYTHDPRDPSSAEAETPGDDDEL